MNLASYESIILLSQLILSVNISTPTYYTSAVQSNHIHHLRSKLSPRPVLGGGGGMHEKPTGSCTTTITQQNTYNYDMEHFELLIFAK